MSRRTALRQAQGERVDVAQSSLAALVSAELTGRRIAPDDAVHRAALAPRNDEGMAVEAAEPASVEAQRVVVLEPRQGRISSTLTSAATGP